MGLRSRVGTVLGCAAWIGALASALVGSVTCGPCSPAWIEAAPSQPLGALGSGSTNPTVAQCVAAGCRASVDGYPLSTCQTVAQSGSTPSYDICLYYLPTGSIDAQNEPGKVAPAGTCVNPCAGEASASCRVFSDGSVGCAKSGICPPV